MFDNPAFDAHERVVFAQDKESGLRAIVAVHSTRRGPGAGGCRFWQYRSSAGAGGIIRVGREYPGGASAASIEAGISKIPERLTEIFARSRAENRPTSDIADEMAKRLITQA